MEPIKTRELNQEEFEALSKDLNEVLTKHNCELGVIASISLTKRVEEEVSEEAKDVEVVPSPFIIENGEENNTKESNT